MSTVTNTNNTDTNAAGGSQSNAGSTAVPTTSPAAPTTSPAVTTTSLGGWAGALFSILLELESLSSKVLSDMLQHQLNDFGMSFDAAIDARKQTQDEADKTKKATIWEGAGAAISAGIALGCVLATGIYSAKSSAAKNASEANTQFEHLNKVKTNILNGPAGGPHAAAMDPFEGPNVQAGITPEEQARINEWKEGRFSDTQQVTTHNPVTDDPFEIAKGDELREYDLRLSSKIGENRDAILAKVDKAIEQANSTRSIGHDQIRNFIQNMQLVEQVTQSGSNAMSSFAKAPLNSDAGYDRARATLDQTEQQASSQASANIKSFADKMAESGSNAVSQFIQAIQIGLKTA
jgi:hypothetical protein